MPEEKIKEIIDRNKSRDQKIIGTAITIAIAVCGWYLSSINSQMSSFNEKIVESNLKTNELMIRMIKTEESIESNKVDIKELSKRTGSLERVVEGHERQLRGK